jgi:hypothetical protein
MTLDGKWEITFKTPMGERTGTLDLAVDGGTLKGSFSGPQGSQEFAGTVDGDAFAWKNEVSGPMGALELSWAGKLEGDAISGEVQFGSFGNGEFKGVRK